MATVGTCGLGRLVPAARWSGSPTPGAGAARGTAGAPALALPAAQPGQNLLSTAAAQRRRGGGRTGTSLPGPVPHPSQESTSPSETHLHKPRGAGRNRIGWGPKLRVQRNGDPAWTPAGAVPGETELQPGRSAPAALGTAARSAQLTLKPALSDQFQDVLGNDSWRL